MSKLLKHRFNTEPRASFCADRAVCCLAWFGPQLNMGDASSEDASREREKEQKQGARGSWGFFHLPRDPRALTFVFPSLPIYSLLSLAFHPPLKNPRVLVRIREWVIHIRSAIQCANSCTVSNFGLIQIHPIQCKDVKYGNMNLHSTNDSLSQVCLFS